MINISKLILALLIVLLSCSHKANEFRSLQELADRVVSIIQSGSKDDFNKIVVSRSEFIKSIHPYTPEGIKDKSITGQDIFDNFIYYKRLKAINQKFLKYKSADIIVKNIGIPQKVTHTPKFNMLRNIPVVLEITDNNGKKTEITDDQILGIVIERNNKYILLNIFE